MPWCWPQAPSTITLDEVLQREIGRDKSDLRNYRCTIGAHRGSSVVFQENTLVALAVADRDPAYAFIEFDVQYTIDKKIVVFHDRTLLRLFGSFRSVRSATYNELLEATDGSIISFEKIMPMLHKPLNIEIKSCGDDEKDKELADEVIAYLRAHNRLDQTLISSISRAVVQHVKETNPEVATGEVFWLTSSTYLHFERLTARLYKRFATSRADYLMLHVANLRNIELLLQLKPSDKTVAFWDFDDRMYLVHKDFGDRLWSSSVLSEMGRRLGYFLR